MKYIGWCFVVIFLSLGLGMILDGDSLLEYLLGFISIACGVATVNGLNKQQREEDEFFE